MSYFLCFSNKSFVLCSYLKMFKQLILTNASIRMDVQLNFLQHEPTANWFDYFLERKKLFELLNRKPIDRLTAISFCDQFIEQAMVGERELVTMERSTSVEKDSVAVTQYKIEDLWLCALSCFAACDWDLCLLIKNSNVIRVGSLLNRLILWAFESKMNLHSRTLLAEDPFNFLNSFASDSTTKIFFGWLYARWVLKTDLDGRFPAPPARPTVSNPYFSIDQSLLQAERLSQVALEVRGRMGEAVTFLKRLVDDGRIRGDTKVEVPDTMCFLPNFNITTKRPFLPKANSGREPSKVTWHSLRRKTLFDLMLAHFSAKHFHKAKQFLCKTLSCKMCTEDEQRFVGDLLHIDQKELDSYRNIFKMDTDNLRHIQPPTVIVPHAADPLLSFARHKLEMEADYAKHVVRLLSAGICRLSKHQLNRLREDEEARRALIDQLSAELLRFPRGSLGLPKAEALRYVRLCGCIYFLCALLPGFVELLPKLSPQLLEAPHSLKTRFLVVLPAVSVSQPPSEEYLKEFLSSGPPLWSLMFSFDFSILYDTFAKNASQLLISEQKMIFSLVLAEPILRLSATGGDKMKLWNQLMLWKLEQLARMGNIPKWKELLNKFVETSPNFRENATLKNFFIYDTIRIELVNWCRDFCRSNDSSEFAKRSNAVQSLLNSTLTIALNSEHNVFQRFGMELAHYLINSRQWRLANERIKAQPLFKTPFTDIAVILEVVLFKLYEERKRDEAYKVVRDVFWKVISPTFDEIRQGVEFRNALINKNYFLEFLQGIKDPDALSIFFGMAAFLYNFSLTTAPTALIDGTSNDDPFQQMQIAGAHLARAVNQQIYVEDHELWQTVRLDEYRNRPLDVPFIKQVLAVLCKQAQIAGPIRVSWLRIRADYAFACECYDEATRLYLEMLMALQHGLLTMNDSEEMEPGGTDRITADNQKMDTDLVYAKIAVALHHLRMPTLAAIIGQMRVDISPHLDMVEQLLRNTPLTVDAGHAYFPLIADIHLMEKMAAAYERFELPLYQQALLELMPTRAINVNNLPVILERECMRRRQRFIEIVFKQFGDQLSL